MKNDENSSIEFLSFEMPLVEPFEGLEKLSHLNLLLNKNTLYQIIILVAF